MLRLSDFCYDSTMHFLGPTWLNSRSCKFSWKIIFYIYWLSHKYITYMRTDSKFGGYRPAYVRGLDHQNSYISNRTATSGVHSEHLRKMTEEVEMYPSGFSELLKFE